MACLWAAVSFSLPAQSIEGTWNFVGLYFEDMGGESTEVNVESESGTITFTKGEGDNYAGEVTGDDPGGFVIALEQQGNVFTGSEPNEVEEGETSDNVLRIVVYDDVAILTSAHSSVSTVEGLEGYSFVFDATAYVLTREERPTPGAVAWPGVYDFRLHTTDFRVDINALETRTEVNSIQLSESGDGLLGVVANFDGPTYDLDFGQYGAEGSLVFPIGGPTEFDDAITRDHYDRTVWAVQLDEERVAWLQATALIGTVNTGTPDVFYVVAEGAIAGGIATRRSAAAPVITRQPTDVAVLADHEAFFMVDVTAAPEASFAWERSTDGGMTWTNLVDLDESNFSNADSAVLQVNTNATDSGDQFRVIVTNSAGSMTSDAATLTELAEPAGRLSNLSVRTALEAEQNLAVGFVMQGGSKPLLVRAVGPTLADFGVGSAMADPRIGFNDPQGNEIDANDDWSASLSDTFGALGAFALTEGSADAALLVTLDGLATVSVSGPEAGTVLVEVYDVDDTYSPRLSNVSARNEVGTGEDILIAGFVVSGETSKNLLIRAVGPGLAEFIPTGTLADPQLQIFDGDGTLIASNDDWDRSLEGVFDLTGAFYLDEYSRDAAMVITLPPGRYTAQVSGADGGTGQAIVEIYELP